MTRRAMAWMLVMPVLALPAPAAEDPGAALRDAAARLERHLDGAAPEDPLADDVLAGVRERLAAGGVDADLAGVLVPARAADAAELRAIARRLRECAELAAEPLVATPDGARETLQAILEDPVFRADAEPGIVEGRLNRLRSTVGAWMQRLVGAVGRHGSTVFWGAGAVGVVALVYVVVTLLRPLQDGRRRHRGLRPPALRVSDAPASADARWWLREGEQALANGDAVRGLELLERAGLLALQQRGRLPDRPGLTDLEGIALLGGGEGDDAEGRRFRGLSELHERIVYAGRAPSPDALSRATDLARFLVLQAEGVAG